MKNLFNRFLHSVQTKVTILLLAISIIPLLIASVLIVNHTTAITEKQVQQTQTNTAELNANFIDHWFQEKIYSIKNLIETYPEIQSGNTDEIIPILKVISATDENVKWYTYVDADGNAIDTLGRESNISAQDHFHFTKKTKDVYISDIIQDINTREDILIIDVPTLDKEGNFIGIIQAILDPIEIVQIINTIELGDSGYGYLVAKNKTILAHPNQELIGTSVSESIQEGDRFEQAILTKKNGYLSFENNMIAFEQIHTTGWHLLISVPETVVLSSVNTAKLYTAIIIIVSVIIVGAIAYLFTKYILKHMKDIMVIMESVSSGDLTKRLSNKGKDEITHLRTNINNMLDTFLTMTQKISIATEQVVASSDQLKRASGASTELSDKIAGSTNFIISGAQGQLEASRQTSLSTEEMASGVQRIADTAVEISSFASNVAENVDQGNEQVTQAITQINVASDSVEGSVKAVRELQEKSEAVHQIVELISHIADEINLLALNATIEAARAGQHGRGFAVVANEVKKLAVETSEATNNIATILEEITTSTEHSAHAMESSLIEVNNGVSQVQKIETLFQAILHSFEEVTNEIQDISAISEQIAAGTEEVAASAQDIVDTNEDSLEKLNEISSYIEEQVNSMDAITEASKGLNDMAMDLQQLIREFKI